MRSHKTIKVTTLSLLFIGAVAAHLSLSYHRHRPAPYESIRRTAKMVPPLHIEVSQQDSNSTNGFFTLVARITPAHAVGRVRWEWQGSRGVELLDSTSGYFEIPEGETEHELTMRFKQLSEVNELVHLRIYNSDSQSQLVGAFTYNTLDQEKLEAETAAIIERQREYHDNLEGQSVLSSEAEAANKAADTHEH